MDRQEITRRMRLESGLRTAVACTIIGCTTLYGPAHLRSQLAFPAFSYVTAIIIVSASTLGETLQESWNALLGTLHVVPLSILCLWVVGPAKFSAGTAAVAVTATSFLMALPERTALLCKRIGFGQAVIVYVGAVIYGDEAGPVTHPLHLASSTALGALASILATLFPYPRLAIWEARKLFESYNQNAAERMSLFIKGILSQDNPAAADVMSQSQPFAEIGTKLLQSVELVQGGILRERPRIKGLQHQTTPGDRMQDLETTIRGMEMALTSCPSFPVNMIEQELSNNLLGVNIELKKQINEARCFSGTDAMISPETQYELFDKSLQSLTTIPQTQKNLPVFFFLYCIGLLVDSTRVQPSKPTSANNQKSGTEESIASRVKAYIKRICNISNIVPSRKGLIFATKCSLSLGLAVFLGLIFSKENGYWSGLTIAISFVTGRQPTFTVADARAQGTAIGSVYGVLGCFIFHKLTELRARLATSKISDSHKTSTFQELGALQECIQQIGFHSGQKDMPEYQTFLAFKEKHRTLKSHVNALKELSKEAKMEPDFWYLPFRAACYDKLQSTLSKTVDLLQFVDYIMEVLPQVSQRCGLAWRELQEPMTSDLQLFKDDVSSSLKYLEKITMIKSLEIFEKQLQEGKIFHDLEAGQLLNKNVRSSAGGDDAVEKITNSYILRSEEVAEKVCANECEEELKGKMILCLSSLGFCIDRLMRETKAIENGIKELVRWENPSRHINFNDFSCKIYAAYP